MNRTVIIGTTAVVLLLIAIWATWLVTRPPPQVDINAGGTSVSIGKNGVSITVPDDQKD